MNKTVQDLAREACGCVDCSTGGHIDGCKVWTIERALVEHEKVVRAEYNELYAFAEEMAAQGHEYYAHAIKNRANDALSTLRARKPADTEEGA